jgi:hypothetical protein
MEDNQGCIHMAKAQGNHKRVKHLDLKTHFIRQAVDAGTVTLKHVPTNDQLADALTKALPRQRFELLRNKMMNILDHLERVGVLEISSQILDYYSFAYVD